MFVIPTSVGLTHRVVAMLVACAVVLASLGVYTATAQAANLVLVSNTLTDSAPSSLSGHFFSFRIPTGSTVIAADDYSIIFPAGFTGVSTLVAADLTVRVNASAPITITNFAASGQTVTFDGVAAAASSTVTVQMAATKVTNPATIQSYEFQITVANPTADSGRTRVAIVNNVVVTAIVNTTFNFVISGLATSTAINATSTTGSTTATLIPFGALNANQIYTMAQQLNVTTNAANGFVVTVEQDGNLRSSTGADIDGFSNGTNVNTPTAWSAPSNVLLTENTWGHWGLTSNDTDLNSSEFTTGGGNRWVAASTTPRQVFSHNGPSDGTSQDAGLARVGYQIQITPLQEAADDYTTTLTYIATPTF